MNRKYRRNRKNSLRRERIIMITSSAFVLAALTMTGIYFNEQNVESQDDGYTIDFTALEDTAEEKSDQLAQNYTEEKDMTAQAENSNAIQQNNIAGTQVAQADTNTQADGTEGISAQGNSTRDMLNEIAMNIGEGDGTLQAELADEELNLANAEGTLDAEGATKKSLVEEAQVEASSGQVEVARTLHFSEEDGLVRPISGDILMNYSMDGSIYFATLDQYKYNPATIFAAEEGASVSACAEGKVQDIYANEELGNIIVLELGDGYLATYGQLKDLEVAEGDFVKAGDVIGSVAAPTKYYSVEGVNLYFQIAKDGVPMNSESLFK